MCQVAYAAGEALLSTACRHRFHLDCAREWLLRYSKRCPLCKAEACAPAE